jgi:tRNA(Ile)-lysidine synthase TilS/MesJ
MKLDIPLITPTGNKIKTIGIWMSGGADSSLLCYLLAKEIKTQNIPIKIQPLTVQKRPNIFESIPVKNKIIELLDAENIFSEHIVYHAPATGWDTKDYLSMFAKMNRENIRQDLFQALFSGITTNPPREVQENFQWGILEDVELKRGSHLVKDTVRYFIESENSVEYEFLEYKPFFNITKKHIAELYQEHGLLDSLFSLTRSCEDRNFLQGHCGKCWWCEERLWAFERLE